MLINENEILDFDFEWNRKKFREVKKRHIIASVISFTSLPIFVISSIAFAIVFSSQPIEQYMLSLFGNNRTIFATFALIELVSFLGTIIPCPILWETQNFLKNNKDRYFQNIYVQEYAQEKMKVKENKEKQRKIAEQKRKEKQVELIEQSIKKNDKESSNNYCCIASAFDDVCDDSDMYLGFRKQKIFDKTEDYSSDELADTIFDGIVTTISNGADFISDNESESDIFDGGYEDDDYDDTFIHNINIEFSKLKTQLLTNECYDTSKTSMLLEELKLEVKKLEETLEIISKKDEDSMISNSFIQIVYDRKLYNVPLDERILLNIKQQADIKIEFKSGYIIRKNVDSMATFNINNALRIAYLNSLYKLNINDDLRKYIEKYDSDMEYVDETSVTSVKTIVNELAYIYYIEYTSKYNNMDLTSESMNSVHLDKGFCKKLVKDNKTI